MLTTILVPLDGSSLAECALPPAENLARGGGTRIVLVRVAHARLRPGFDVAAEQVRAIEEAETYLQGLAAGLRGRGFAVETAVPFGLAADAIVDEVRIRHADLVVMATHGRSGFGRWLYGSVAESVVGRVERPVLLVRAWQEASRGGAEGQPRIVVPLDGSTFAEAALPVAVELAATLGAGLTLLQVLLPPTTLERYGDGRVVAYLDQKLASLEAGARDYLDAVRRRLVGAQPSIDVQVEVRAGAASDLIVSTSAELGATLVVMATHGRTGLSRVFLGSVAGSVLRFGSVPVVLVRPTTLAPMVAAAPAAELAEPATAPAPDVTVTLTSDEVALVRAALLNLDQSFTRHEHVHERIRGILDRLAAEEEVAVEEAAPSGAPRR